MSVLQVLHIPDERLRKVAKPVEEVNAEIQRIVDDMFETMYAEEGIGLAATQVDIHQRIIVIDVSENRDERLVLINPELLEKSGETGIEEGCLSIPEQRALVPRAEKVKIRALDRDGKPFELEADGLLAICIQHEMDHLVGKLFACHFLVEVGTFDVQSQYGAVGLCHKLLAHLGCLVQLFERRRGNGRVETRSTMTEVCIDDAAKRFFGTFGEVVAATAMRVHTHEAGHDIHAFGIDEACADEGEVTVGHFEYFSVAHQDGTFIQPALRGEYASVDNLSKHF